VSSGKTDRPPDSFSSPPTSLLPKSVQFVLETSHRPLGAVSQYSIGNSKVPTSQEYITSNDLEGKWRKETAGRFRERKAG
jgi:hypothetical protein